MSQEKQILKYLKSHVGLTQAQAVEKFGCYRLSARIHDLREAGFKIESITRERTNRYGNMSRFVEYRLCK